MNRERLKNHPESSPAPDPDYIAYKAQEEQLKREHMGEWVAFSDGQLIIVAADKDTLFREAAAQGITGYFYHQIKAEENILRSRSPRRP